MSITVELCFASTKITWKKAIFIYDSLNTWEHFTSVSVGSLLCDWFVSLVLEQGIWWFLVPFHAKPNWRIWYFISNLSWNSILLSKSSDWSLCPFCSFSFQLRILVLVVRLKEARPLLSINQIDVWIERNCQIHFLPYPKVKGKKKIKGNLVSFL